MQNNILKPIFKKQFLFQFEFFWLSYRYIELVPTKLENNIFLIFFKNPLVIIIMVMNTLFIFGIEIYENFILKFFAAHSNVLIPISLQPNGVNIWNIKFRLKNRVSSKNAIHISSNCTLKMLTFSKYIQTTQQRILLESNWIYPETYFLKYFLYFRFWFNGLVQIYKDLHFLRPHLSSWYENHICSLNQTLSMYLVQRFVFPGHFLVQSNCPGHQYHGYDTKNWFM